MTDQNVSSRLLPPNFKELHIVITEGRPELVRFAEELEPALRTATSGQYTLLQTLNALSALQAIRHYGYVPLLQVVGDTRQEGQTALALNALHSLSERYANSVHDAYKVERDGKEAVVPVLDDTTMGSAIGATLRHRGDLLMMKQQYTSTGGASIDELIEGFDERFPDVVSRHPSLNETGRAPLSIIKVGGSMHDVAMSQNPADSKTYENLITAIANAYKSGHNIMITVGGGSFLDPAKQTRDNLGMSPENYVRAARRALLTHAELVAEKLKQLDVTANIIGGDMLEGSGEQAKTILQTLESAANSHTQMKYVPIILTIPPGYPNAGDYTALPEQSDRLSVALAHLFQVPNILFFKDTDGVHPYDPKLSPDQIKRLPTLIQMRTDNLLIKRMYAQDVPDAIARGGADGRPGHLVEDDALKLLIMSPRVGSLQIVNGRDPTDVFNAITRNEPVGSYFLK